MYRHLLVPTDGTEISTRNVGEAVDFARGIGARVTFLHAHRDYSATADGALMRSVAPSTFTELAAGEARAILAKAEAAARAAGVPCSSVALASNRPSEAILETVATEHCDLVFMASHGPRGIGGVMLGSQTLKVLARAPVPVLVSRVARAASGRERDTAIAIIQDEHRSLAAVLHALTHHVAEASSGAARLDARLLRAMLHYLSAFPEALHHPKEDAFLFRRLVARAPDLAAVIDELQRQHVEGASLLRALGDAADACTAGGTGALPALAAALERFARAQYRHMDLEESVVLPAASERLAPEDWAAIAEAFGRNGDPRFDADVDEGYRSLFARIMNLAAVPAATSESPPRPTSSGRSRARRSRC